MQKEIWPIGCVTKGVHWVQNVLKRWKGTVHNTTKMSRKVTIVSIKKRESPIGIYKLQVWKIRNMLRLFHS